jgi:hypothetical protein
VAKASGRNVPFLWVGPPATDRRSPQSFATQAKGELSRYTLDMVEAVQRRGIDTLGMYNVTLQASGWDGPHYGERTFLVQAMMVSRVLSFQAKCTIRCGDCADVD